MFFALLAAAPAGRDFLPFPAMAFVFFMAPFYQTESGQSGIIDRSDSYKYFMHLFWFCNSLAMILQDLCNKKCRFDRFSVSRVFFAFFTGTPSDDVSAVRRLPHLQQLFVNGAHDARAGNTESPGKFLGGQPVAFKLGISYFPHGFVRPTREGTMKILDIAKKLPVLFQKV